jgi:uronate dehydrogenase
MIAIKEGRNATHIDDRRRRAELEHRCENCCRRSIRTSCSATSTRRPASAAAKNSRKADLANFAEVEAICDGVDGILHFGAIRSKAPGTRSIRPTSSAATICSRRPTKWASSALCSRRPTTRRLLSRHHRIGPDVTARPDSRYGVSKVFGEALGGALCRQARLKVTCIRIGNFGDVPLDHRRLSIWLKPEDLVQLCRIGLEHPDIHFEVLYGASYNERAWWDNHRAYDLGYRPTGRARISASTRWRSRPSCKPIRSAISTRAARSAAWSLMGQEQDRRLEVTPSPLGLISGDPPR